MLLASKRCNAHPHKKLHAPPLDPARLLPSGGNHLALPVSIYSEVARTPQTRRTEAAMVATARASSPKFQPVSRRCADERTQIIARTLVRMPDRKRCGSHSKRPAFAPQSAGALAGHRSSSACDTPGVAAPVSNYLERALYFHSRSAISPRLPRKAANRCASGGAPAGTSACSSAASRHPCTPRFAAGARTRHRRGEHFSERWPRPLRLP